MIAGLLLDPRTDTWITVAEYVARNRRESEARETVTEVASLFCVERMWVS